MSKTDRGRFLEDFRLGETLIHAVPRTITSGDVALYTALYGSRFALFASDSFARSMGLPGAPLDPLLVFHSVFGKSVPDVSLNAVANLGYAEGRFLAPVYSGDTLSATSEVIGLKENSNGRTGVVYVRTTGRNQDGADVLSYARWVMVRKRDTDAAVETHVPELAASVPAAGLAVPQGLSAAAFDPALAGTRHFWEDYEAGERIDHVDGMTIEEAEHRLATRLYHNTARVHFNSHAERGERFGRCIVYGGHIISLAHGLSFNGLAGSLGVAAINAGRHVAPCFAGDTIYAWSEILERAALPGRSDLGALRLRLIAAKDRPCHDFPDQIGTGYDPAVVLDLDIWTLMPRRGAT
ncbi:MaoC family dehydratase [Marinivivus vitaminiproducens]|uniref:MaoC family dehydratase n=1 Tax=Marinivivus vitaminiproducens TaxID=3035935 RepID=UPI0027A1DAEA|nr:MaoC family dehydratase [Geminicoccaceae bacterium SCSIO 64248]